VDYAELVKAEYVSAAFNRSAFKFAFTRNPYDRLASLYVYSQRVGRLEKHSSFLTFCRQLSERGCEPIGLYNSIGLSQCNPQVRWLEQTRIDYLGAFETLDRDIPKLLDVLNISSVSAIPHLNATQRRSYFDYYCEESRQIVEDLYDEDFRSFGYEKHWLTRQPHAA
jgi:hypothetical protein